MIGCTIDLEKLFTNTMDEIISEFDQFFIFSINKIEFLKYPTDFYEKLLTFFAESKEARCKTLSFGNKEKSKKILEILESRKKSGKITKIVLDKNRAHRSGNLIELINKHDLEDIFYFFQPRAPICIPKKLQELVSVLHSKIYLFDENIILSGANLDDLYFSNRMDRYIVLQDPQFSSFLKFKHFSSKEQKNLFETDLLTNYRDVDSKTIIFEFEQKDEIEVLKKILTRDYEEIILSTAYLNFTGKHFELFEDVKMKIVTCSKQTNTFNLDTYFEQFINDEYTLSTISVIEKLKKAEFYVYMKENFTFHCKGLWAFGKDYALSIIGSTNFNVRSISRDIETNFCIITEDTDVIQGLRNEIANIMKDTKQITLDELKSKEVSIVSKIGKPASHQFL